MQRLSTTRTRSRATRAISPIPASTSPKWWAASRHVDDVEAPVGEGEVLGRADDVGLHPGEGSAVTTSTLLAQPPRDVPAAGRDVERRPRSRRPLDDQVEIPALSVLGALPVGLRALVPDAHRAPASSTTLSAAESIVSST